MKILFVCTGNTCRSPMAHVMAEQLFKKKGGSSISITSAGIMAAHNTPASAHAVAVMHERQIDLSGHRSQMVTEALLADADIIFAMTESHKAALSKMTQADKIHILGLSDPYGGDINIYRACADEIYGLLLKLQHSILSNREEALNNLHVTDHPLVESKLTMLRDKKTGNKEFRELVGEIATFICYEATRDIPLTEVEIETPIRKMKARQTGRKFAIVPILRAGLGMVDGVSNLLPTAKIGHIGIFRDPETAQPVDYYCKLPPDCADRETLLLDPMIATAGTALSAIDFLKRNNVKNIKMLSLVVSPEGVKRIFDEHPDVCIYTAALDEGIDDNKYIVPGLGDAGDRIFGTK